MRAFSLRPVWLGAALVLLPGAANAGEPVLHRVLMSTGGVALYEYTAAVTNTATPLTLDVRLDQVDDVLRSLMVADPAGPVLGVRLAGRDALAETFRNLPFPVDALTSPAALLDALKGTPVTIGGPKAISGRVVSVSPETIIVPDRGSQTRHRLGLMTAQGLRQVILEDTDALSFDDPAIADAVRRALAALEASNRKDTRTLEVQLSPGAGRSVRLAHIAEAPLWKASYRLTLAQSGSGGVAEGRLSGWASLENLSGHDWQGIRLTVVSGNPVTFRQDLYTPYRVERPIVPVEVYGRVLPPPDEGAVEGARGAGAAAKAAPPPLAMAMAAPARRSALEALDEKSIGWADPPAAPAAAATEAVTAQVLYTFPSPVTLGNGQTLLAPLLDRPLPVARVAHVQGGGDHPLAAVRVTNNTETGLPPGPVSLTQESGEGLAFLGDARLPVVPAGESRLLAFAVDQEISVHQEEGEDRLVAGLTAARGVLTVRQVTRADTRYVLRNAAAEERTVVIDHPERVGWTLVPPEGVESVEKASGAHRITVRLPAGKEQALVVRLERTDQEILEVGSLDPSVLARLSAGGGLGEREKQAVEGLTQLAARAAEYDSRAERIEEQLAELSNAQEEVRKNLQAVPAGSDLHNRFLERLGRLDERQTTLEKQRTDATNEADEARSELENLIGTLSLP